MAKATDQQIRDARQRLLSAWNRQWTARQIKRGVDGPVPAGRKNPSDYNVEYPAMESSGAAQDLYFARGNAIMKMTAAELGLEDESEEI